MNPLSIEAPEAKPASAAGAPSRTDEAAAKSVHLGEATALDALSGVDVVADSFLRRDDALGNLFRKVFDLPPPAMPNFSTTEGAS